MRRSPKNLVLFGGLALWGGLLVSCVMTDRAVLVPPFIEGSSIVGSNACVKCHGNISSAFHDATHSPLAMKDEKGAVKNVACESCHGPGSLHIKAGTRTTIINPKVSPDTCLQCHVNARSEFSLP